MSWWENYLVAMSRVTNEFPLVECPEVWRGSDRPGADPAELFTTSESEIVIVRRSTWRAASVRCDRCCGVFALVLSALVFSGCGGAVEKPVENVVPVSGKVTFDGKPQAGIQVIFTPIGGNTESRGGNAVTDAAGAFSLKNYMGADGVPAGQYSVTFSWIVGPDGNPPKQGQPPIPGVTAVERIPAMWSDRTKKGRHNSVTIPEAGNTSLDYKIPAK